MLGTFIAQPGCVCGSSIMVCLSMDTRCFVLFFCSKSQSRSIKKVSYFLCGVIKFSRWSLRLPSSLWLCHACDRRAATRARCVPRSVALRSGCLAGNANVTLNALRKFAMWWDWSISFLADVIFRSSLSSSFLLPAIVEQSSFWRCYI